MPRPSLDPTGAASVRIDVRVSSDLHRLLVEVLKVRAERRMPGSKNPSEWVRTMIEVDAEELSLPLPEAPAPRPSPSPASSLVAPRPSPSPASSLVAPRPSPSLLDVGEEPEGVRAWAERMLRKVGDASGASAVARAVLDAEEAAVGRLADLAREHGVTEGQIAAAKSAKSKLERLQSLAALLFPIIPSPVVLRALAGSSEGPPSAPSSAARRDVSPGAPDDTKSEPAAAEVPEVSPTAVDDVSPGAGDDVPDDVPASAAPALPAPGPTKAPAKVKPSPAAKRTRAASPGRAKAPAPKRKPAGKATPKRGR